MLLMDQLHNVMLFTFFIIQTKKISLINNDIIISSTVLQVLFNIRCFPVYNLNRYKSQPYIFDHKIEILKL